MTAAALRFKHRFDRLAPDRLAGRLQAVLLALPVLLLLALVLTLALAAPVRAADDPACGAKDLVAGLRISDPAASRDRAGSLR